MATPPLLPAAPEAVITADPGATSSDKAAATTTPARQSIKYITTYIYNTINT